MSTSDKSTEPDFYAQIPTAAVDVLSSIRNTIGEGFCLSSEDGVIQDVNQQFASWLGYERHAMIDQHIAEFIPEKLRPYARMHQQEFFLQETKSRGQTWDYLDSQGNQHEMKVMSSRLKVEGNFYKMDIISQLEVQEGTPESGDIEKFQEKSRHLFKNTLQEISGLLQLQAGRLQGKTREVMLTSQQRNAVIVVAFEQLYKYRKADEIEVSAYLRKVLAVNQLTEESLSQHPEFTMEISRCYALGLILNEILMHNKSRQATLTLSGQLESDHYWIRLTNRQGMEGVPLSGFGHQLVAALQRQLMAVRADTEDNKVLLSLKIPL